VIWSFRNALYQVYPRTVSGPWTFHQGNGFDVGLCVGHGPSPDGAAKQKQGSIGGHFNHGELSAQEFHIVIFWDNGATGDYSGTVGIDGRLRGITFDVNNPQSQALWHSEKQFRQV
jgi:hypothetical protein